MPRDKNPKSSNNANDSGPKFEAQPQADAEQAVPAPHGEKSESDGGRPQGLADLPNPTGWTRLLPLARPCGLLLHKIPFAVSQTAQVHHSAQGCRVGEVTLGHLIHYFSQPQRGWINGDHADGCNPFRVVEFSRRLPRVVRSEPDWPTSQPWTERPSPVGAKTFRSIDANLGPRMMK